MTGKLVCLVGAAVLASTSAHAICPYDANCLNNPYSGRDNSSQGISPAPFGAGPGQYNPSYAVNPDQSNSTYNPYSPPPNPNADVNPGEVPSLSKGLGLGPKQGIGSLKDLGVDLLGEDRLGRATGSAGSLHGVDADKRIQNNVASKRGLPSASGSLKGVDPDMQR
jgi:hypothetical protein